jgi:hypothetical protein
MWLSLNIIMNRGRVPKIIFSRCQTVGTPLPLQGIWTASCDPSVWLEHRGTLARDLFFCGLSLVWQQTLTLTNGHSYCQSPLHMADSQHCLSVPLFWIMVITCSCLFSPRSEKASPSPPTNLRLLYYPYTFSVLCL